MINKEPIEIKPSLAIIRTKKFKNEVEELLKYDVSDSKATAESIMKLVDKHFTEYYFKRT